jgi:RNA polymerase-binding transcription factor DksA
VSFEQTFDQHDDEQGPPAQPFTLRTLEEIEGIMSGVARSIEALDNGTYGNCEQCATPIAKQTMIENPLATRCDAHVVRERPVLFAQADLAGSEESDSVGAESAESVESELADA